MAKSPAKYADLANMQEDTRIDVIGMCATRHKMVTAFIVETHEKADRYIAALRKLFPGIKIIERFDGPLSGMVTVKVGPSE